MFFDDAPPHSSNFETPESSLRFRMMVAEFLHDWFEVMSQVAYQTHRACEFFVQNGSPLNRHHGPFGSRAWRDSSAGSNGSIDIDKLRECLQSMDPSEAAKVMHAVQTMQAMEAMLRRYGSRANEAEGDAW
jgi:hypothetical protein